VPVLLELAFTDLLTMIILLFVDPCLETVSIRVEICLNDNHLSTGLQWIMNRPTRLPAGVQVFTLSRSLRTLRVLHLLNTGKMLSPFFSLCSKTGIPGERRTTMLMTLVVVDVKGGFGISIGRLGGSNIMLDSVVMLIIGSGHHLNNRCSSCRS
jgi:hypothetical protein